MRCDPRCITDAGVIYRGGSGHNKRQHIDMQAEVMLLAQRPVRVTVLLQWPVVLSTGQWLENP